MLGFKINIDMSGYYTELVENGLKNVFVVNYDSEVCGIFETQVEAQNFIKNDIDYKDCKIKKFNINNTETYYVNKDSDTVWFKL